MFQGEEFDVPLESGLGRAALVMPAGDTAGDLRPFPGGALLGDVDARPVPLHQGDDEAGVLVQHPDQESGVGGSISVYEAGDGYVQGEHFPYLGRLA